MLAVMPASRPGAAAGEHHQAIVIGAGIVGLSAARSLGRRGLRVLVLEAVAPGHAGAGSKGEARIFRLGYPDPLYVEMAELALGLWRELEEQSGARLLEVTGQLTFGPQAPGVAEALAKAGSPCQPLTPAEATARFPQLRLDGPSFYEVSSGVLAADRCLRVLTESAPFVLRQSVPVRVLEDDGLVVSVVLADDTRLSADVVVNCAGHHAINLLGGPMWPTPGPPTLQQVAYFSIDGATSSWPVFIEWGEDMIYGLPVPGRPLYKLAQHVPATPLSENEDVNGDDADLLATLTNAARRLLPRIDPSPVATERCVYDNTVDGDFIIDRVGRIVVGCGTSGHGFKFGPLLGEALADLAVGSAPPCDLGRFALSRPHRPTVLDP
jgi:sarcosine oxidase